MALQGTRRACFGLGGALLAAPSRARHETEAEDLVRMPSPPWTVTPERPYFPQKLLELALAKAGRASRVELLAAQTWPRQVREMRDGHCEVAPLPALDAAYAEFKLLRVDFPLRRGLLGLRRFVVRADRVAEFASVRTLAQLQSRFRMGYGHEWADRPYMERLGFQVVAERSKDLMYEGLHSGRTDFLSRGLHEWRTELHRYGAGQPGLAVLPRLAMFYPLDDCFYLAPGRGDLKAAIDKGLRLAWANGSYKALFRSFYEAELVALSDSQVLELKGYPMPPGLPLGRFDVRTLIPPAARA